MAGRGSGSGPPGLAGDRPALSASDVSCANEVAALIGGAARRPGRISRLVGADGAPAREVASTAEEEPVEAVSRARFASGGVLVEGAGEVVVVSIRAEWRVVWGLTGPPELVSETDTCGLVFARV
jgi:hypothetical protein